MKNGYLFLSGMAVLALFVFFIVWSVVPIGGQTLPHLLEAHWHWSFRYSAALVSSMAAVLGLCAMLLFAAIGITNDDSGKRSRE